MTYEDNTDDPILRRVQKLVDKAWSTTFPEEKQALLAKAEALMLKYSLDQFKLLDPNRPNTAAPIKGQDPELRAMFLWGDPPAYPEWKVRDALETMFSSLCRHFGCRIGVWRHDCAKVVGYPADLDFLDMMFLSLKLHLMGMMDPKAEPTQPWQTSVMRMKFAGYGWDKIHRLMQGHPAYPYAGRLWERNIGLSIYNAAKRMHPEEFSHFKKGFNPGVWREDFVAGYASEIRTRLNEMRQAALNENKLLPALLSDKKSSLDKFYEELFPPPPPAPPPDPNVKQPKLRMPVYRERAVNWTARTAGAGAARQADLSNRNSRVSGGSQGEIG